MRFRVFGNPAATLALALTIAWSEANAQDRFIEDIQVSRSNAVGRIVIELACPMRWLTDTVSGSPRPIVELRVSPFESCRRLGSGSGIASEAYRPVSGHLAQLAEVEYESLGLGDDLIYLRFDAPIAYEISQRADLRQLVVTVRESTAAAAAQAQQATPQSPPPQPTVPPAVEVPSRPPLTARLRQPDALADFVVNLQSTREEIEQSLIDSVSPQESQQVYISETTLNGQTWYRLRLGFFATEADARAALEPLQATFPRAWVGRAQPAEITAALSSNLESGVVVFDDSDESGSIVAAPTPRGTAVAGLTEERITQLADAARNAMLDRRYDDAIGIYAQLLSEPGPHQQEAREFLGVAREKLGQVDRASAEYRAYLQEYPDTPEYARVAQRLEGMMTATTAPREPLLAAQSPDDPTWDFVTGISQYYRRDVDRLESSDEDFVGLSALQTDIDFTARRDGPRFDMLSRISASHFYDLIGEEDNGPGDQTRVSYAYFDMIDTQQDWSLRLGRQSLHTWGVLGRFDGMHASYGLTATQRLHFISGYPVDTTRDSVRTERQFYGLAWDFDELIGPADVSVFLNDQQIEGIDSRRAMGAEIHYATQNGNVTGVIDYDVGYAKINSILGLGAWRLANGMTVSGMLDVRKSPILSTRNALIGQPVTTLEELLIVWTEDEIRQLAADRTAESRTMTVGFSQPLGDRFQVNMDLTSTEIDGTVASGGVDALPGTGPQTYLTTSLVGTGLFGESDVNMLNIRYGQGDDFKSSYLTWDARFPIGRRLRLNPRLRLVVRDGLLDGSKRETAALALRLLFNTRTHYRFEAELGVDKSWRTDVLSESTSSGYYFNVGYRASY